MPISNDDKRILLGLIWSLKPSDLSVLYALLMHQASDGMRPATTAVRHTGHEAFWRALVSLTLAEEVEMKLPEEAKTSMPDNILSFSLTDEGKKWVEGGWGLALGGGWPPREAVIADEAIDMLQRYAAENEPVSQSKLASLYQIGAGVEKDMSAARAWYKKAAALEEPTALNNLGIMYFAGEGVEKDFAEAKHLFEKAATAGSAGAMDNLGEMYTQGIGVDKDDAQALGWFLRAAARGHGLAMCKAGIFYLNGQGTAADPLEAYIWLQKGIDSGYNVTDHKEEAEAKLTPDQRSAAEKRLAMERAGAAGTA
jgi:hypothetical protein